MRSEALWFSLMAWITLAFATWLVVTRRRKLPGAVTGAWIGIVMAVLLTAISEAFLGFPQLHADHVSDWREVVAAPFILLFYSVPFCGILLMAPAIVGAILGFAVSLIRSLLRRP